MKKTSLERIKNGVYLLPFGNPEPSENEVRAFERIEDLIRELNVEATYFVATKVEPEHLAEEPRFENGRLDPSSANVYFVLKPIKVLRK